jgi:hypothetical protein
MREYFQVFLGELARIRDGGFPSIDWQDANTYTIFRKTPLAECCYFYQELSEAPVYLDQVMLRVDYFVCEQSGLKMGSPGAWMDASLSAFNKEMGNCYIRDPLSGELIEQKSGDLDSMRDFPSQFDGVMYWTGEKHDY